MIDLVPFLTESLKIEGINRAPTPREIRATERFLALNHLTVGSVKNLVADYAPHASLRDRPGLDVRVGSHFPPDGGPGVRERLESLLQEISNGQKGSFEAHVAYEMLHPFTDGNGRSGRAIWLWQVRDTSLGFLHRFYYQTLAAQRAP